jgi:hypothetical protein
MPLYTLVFNVIRPNVFRTNMRFLLLVLPVGTVSRTQPFPKSFHS